MLIKAKKPFYSFDRNLEPVEKVRSGAELEIETYDCFENQIQSEDTEINKINWDRINPATGPVYVEEAKPGDILAVHINNIELANQGVMTTGPELGVMGHRVEEFTVKMIPLKDNKAVFNDRLKLPLNPMIGVIGVAPEEDPVSCGTPDRHGGNLDTTFITEGATVYFPVFAEGALFGLGDMHAAMGDGEIGVSGIEIPGKVSLKLEVIKGKTIKHPMVANEEGLAILVSAETLDEATKTAVEEMIDLLLPHTDLSLAELTMLMSAIGQTQISQVVDPKLTARFFVPKYFLDEYNIDIFS
ncbi:acetamidase [Pseudalkalibacillus caeni]|uniref:Acetamidase n=1 Tax=Exobacillus caeni TaxID=2574798 RepID=A0A5R9F703_9BACL|nr:acetamidase/formamidase family protein [Pseudalkalibacillus caeni]TLS39397.1 acetamidase [Pseudalkalibacillus caeni]